jgi:DNA-binding transcriptional LysR family regulator
MGTSAEITGADDRVSGLVRLTSVGLIANHLLAPRVHELLSSWPELELELIDSARNLDLARREADIAIRVARPDIDAAIIRRVGRLDFLEYAAAPYASQGDQLPWVVFADSMRDLPESRWLASQVGDDRPQVRVNDIAAMIEVVRSMPARAILPSVSVRPDSGLVPIGRREPVVSRDVWLLFLEGLRGSARVSKVRDWAIRVCEEALN